MKRFNNSIFLLLILAILAYVSQLGCISMAWSEKNSSRNNHREVALGKGTISAHVYQAHDVRYYEIRSGSNKFYIEAKPGNQLMLQEHLPEDATGIGEARIIVTHENDFSPDSIALNPEHRPGEIFVVISRNHTEASSDQQYTLYYSFDNKVHSHGPVRNGLGASATQNIAAALSKAGYLITVPLDIATAPLLLGVLLLSVGH